MPLEHAKVFSPSASSCWLGCAGAPLAQRGIPNSDSHAASEGSAAHQCGENTLKDPDANCKDFIGELMYVSPSDTGDETLDLKHWFLDAEMAEYTQQYVDYVRNLLPTDGSGELLVEVESDFGAYVAPEALIGNGKAWGTSDAVVIEGAHLHVIDLKYGMGIAVEAENNSQALIYALGVYEAYDWFHDFTDITVHIVQPRKSEPSSWTIPTEQLLEFGEHVRERTALIAQDNPGRTAGDKQCQWCRARGDCAARALYMEQILSEGFCEETRDDPTILDNEGALSNDQLGDIVLRSSMITKWLAEAKQAATDRILAGGVFTNIKPVKGRGSYSYVDEDKAAGSLVRLCGTDEAKPRKLVTVAVAKKMKDKKGNLMSDNKRWMSTHVLRKDGNMTLAAMSDKRQALEIIPLSDGFEDTTAEAEDPAPF